MGTPRTAVYPSPVPEQYVGVWKRTLLKTKKAVYDTSSSVLWLQTEHLHCDIRIPVEALAVESHSLAQCSDKEHLALACQYAFAGRTEVEGDIATWTREIDFEPPGQPDVGRMSFISPDLLHEDDPDAASASYHETWERVPGTSDPAQAWGFRLSAADGSGRRGFLLAAGDRFMFAADRTCPLPAEAGSMRELVISSSMPRSHKLQLLGFEVSYGSTQGWTIELSTLPQQRGAALLKGAAGSLSSQEVKKALGNHMDIEMGGIQPANGWRATL